MFHVEQEGVLEDVLEPSGFGLTGPGGGAEASSVFHVEHRLRGLGGASSTPLSPGATARPGLLWWSSSGASVRATRPPWPTGRLVLGSWLGGRRLSPPGGTRRPQASDPGWRTARCRRGRTLVDQQPLGPLTPGTSDGDGPAPSTPDTSSDRRLWLVGDEVGAVGARVVELALLKGRAGWGQAVTEAGWDCWWPGVDVRGIGSAPSMRQHRCQAVFRGVSLRPAQRRRTQARRSGHLGPRSPTR